MYTSPLQRAIETAEILSEPWPIKFAKWDDLKEYGFGELTGLTRDEVMQRFPELQHVSRLDLIEDIYGVEPVAERGIRAIRVVETALCQHQDESTIFMVTHGGILQNIVSATLGSKRTWEIDIANTGVFDFTIDANHWHENGEARLDSSLWHINLFGDASHLC